MLKCLCHIEISVGVTAPAFGPWFIDLLKSDTVMDRGIGVDNTFPQCGGGRNHLECRPRCRLLLSGAVQQG